MSKKIFIIIGIVIILFIIIFYIIYSNRLTKEKEDKFYSKIEETIAYNTYNIDKKVQNNFNTFFSIKKLGNRVDGDNTYIYCWIQIESFYINNDGKVKLYQGSSMPYKISFNGENIVKYQFPKDGAEYYDSIKELFPFWIRVKFDTIYQDNELKNDILEQVEKYYNITSDQIYY